MLVILLTGLEMGPRFFLLALSPYSLLSQKLSLRYKNTASDRKALILPGVMENYQRRSKSCRAQHREAAQLLWIFVVYSCWVLPLILYPCTARLSNVKAVSGKMSEYPCSFSLSVDWSTLQLEGWLSKTLEPSNWALLAVSAPHSCGPDSGTCS